MIQKSADVADMISDVHRTPIESFECAEVDSFFVSDIKPTFTSAEFELKNFEIIRHSEDIFFSDNLCINGLNWRLKIYPNGSFIFR